MTLVLDATYRNRSSANGEDHLGRIYIELTAALVASGFWRRKNQGDGQSAYSSGTSNLFTANGGLGYATSGSWNAAVANSISHARAYIHLEEVVGGSATGRQVLMQRTTGTASSNDRDAVLIFSWEPFTGSPNATTAPTKPTKCRTYGNNDPNSAGDNIFNHLATSPQMGGAGGTIVHNIWVCDAPGGTTEDVCPFWAEVYDSTADEPAFCFGYEAVVDAAAADAHPCFVCLPLTAGATWEFGEITAVNPATHVAATGSGTCLFGISSADGATVEHMSMLRFVFPDSETLPGGTVRDDDVSAQRPILPAQIWTDVGDTSPSAFKGVCESLETLFPTTSHLWPATLFASVAHATERARISLGHVLLPWEVGVTRSGLSSTNSTDLRRIMAVAEVPDETAPTIGSFSPAAGAIAYTQAITIPISDNLDELSHFEIWAEFASRPDERVWSGNAFSSDYSTSTDLSGGNVVVRRDSGWPAAFTLKAKAWDQDNNPSTVGSAAYTISTSPNPAAADSALPTISSITPAPASALVADDTPIEFDVLDDRGLSYFAVYARYLDKRDYDVVWDGEDFAPKYDGSTVEAISGGYHFAVVRDVENVGGWTTQGRVRFKAAAVDTSGNAEAA